MAIVTLTTDFGTKDHYAASMKGAILRVAPSATIVDVTHAIGPQDVFEGAFVLRSVWEAFEPGTVHVAVVDPGVGSSRRIVAGRYGGRLVVAPDNGLVTMVHRDFPLEAMHVVENTRLYSGPVSGTFHGRDILAPVAGHLAKGLAVAEVGSAARQLELLAVPAVTVLSDRLVGQVIYVDHYGNLVTNIGRGDLARLGGLVARCRVWHEQRCVGAIGSCYADRGPGEPVALVGGTDRLEVAVNRGSAAGVPGVGVGDAVEVRWGGGGWACGRTRWRRGVGCSWWGSGIGLARR
mgnify:CR=1 FL=1